MDDSFSSAVFPYFEFKLRVKETGPMRDRTGHCVAKAELSWEGGWRAGEVGNEEFRNAKEKV